MQTAQEVVSALLNRFPAFAKDAFLEGEGPYSILGQFGLYLRDGLVRETLGPNEVERAFEFLNELGAIRDVEVQNLLAVGTLEILVDEQQSTDAARERLRGGALESFEEMFRFWKPSQAGPR